MPLLYITVSVERGFAIRLHTHCYSTVKEACCTVGCHKATCLSADAHMPKILEGRSGIFRERLHGSLQYTINGRAEG